MARKKTNNSAVVNQPKNEILDLLGQIKWGESYMSLFLGIIVVVIASILVITFLKNKTVEKTGEIRQEISAQSTQIKQVQATYTVAEGDTLWDISNKVYKSGYNWTDIAKANNLSNPDVVISGTKLILPEKAEAKVALANVPDANAPNDNITPSKSITASSYTIQTGDDLWDIAVRAYGDGYRFTDIAKANNLVDPNLIHSGNSLVIPR